MVGPVHFKKRTACIVAGLVIALLIGLGTATRYLFRADPPGKSDIIVLFVGPEHDLRRKEAVQLLQEGFSEYLYVPNTFELYRSGPGRRGILPVSFNEIKPGADLPRPRPERELTEAYFRKNRTSFRIPWFYENTHVEILVAKKAMEACGFRKAIFVSSPYHMRRISIIAGSVFDRSPDIRFVPSRFEKSSHGFPASWREFTLVITELSKVIWFLCYDRGPAWMPVKI